MVQALDKIWMYKVWDKIHKVWYKLLVYDYLQAEAQDLQAVQELFTSFIKYFG